MPVIAVICLALAAVLAGTTVGGLGWLAIKVRRSAAEARHEALARATTDAGAARQGTIKSQPTACTEKSCRATAAWLGRQLGESYRVLIRVPFVLAGEAGDDVLASWYEQVVAPAADAMSTRYFRTPPHEPITLVRCSSGEAYRRISERLFSQSPPSGYGYYHPHLRIILLNAGPRSDSAARHELTHALMDFDFPAAPAWLREGLAAMHEEECGMWNAECGNRQPNSAGWAELRTGTVRRESHHKRWPVLQRTVASGRLPSLASLLALKDLHDDQQSLHYAQAMYFCLYLQQQALLERFYQRLRSAAGSDPTGERTLLDLVPDRNWPDWESAFQGYLSGLQ